MADKEYILLVQNNSDDICVKIYIYNEGDNLNWISRRSIIVEPGQERFYQESQPYKYQVKASTLNDVSLLKTHILVLVDCNGHVNEEPLSAEKYSELRRTVVQYAK